MLHSHHSPHVLPHAEGGGWLARVDPRARIVAAVGLTLVVAAAQHFATLGVALAAAAVAVTLSGVPIRAVLRRVLALEVLLLVLVVLLPITTPGTAEMRLGPLSFTREGFALAARIALKGNALVLGLVALTGSMDATMLGHTLAHLRVPQKLTHLLLLTVRYLDVLHRQYRRMRAAMKVRGFRPRMNLHTYRAFAHLVGMLLVRSFDRSERILAAMKCRGFQGRFYLLDHFVFSQRRDLPFCLASLALLGLLVCLEWV